MKSLLQFFWKTIKNKEKNYQKNQRKNCQKTYFLKNNFQNAKNLQKTTINFVKIGFLLKMSTKKHQKILLKNVFVDKLR